MDRAPPALLFLLAVGPLACGDAGVPIPPVHPALETLEGVRFGLRARELPKLRPDVDLDAEGFYREHLGLVTSVGYGFLPWREGRAPAPRARLEGVEVREEVNDSVALREAWEEAVRRAGRWSASGAECRVVRSFRRHRLEATFLDTLRVSVVARVVVSGDGQDHESVLSTRVETPRMREAVLDREGRAGPGGRDGRRMDCPT